MRAAPAFDRVVVTLGAYAREILACVDLHGAEPLVVQGWEEGLAASLRAGVAALAPGADAIIVALGDQPRIDATAIGRMLAEWDGAAPALRASHGGRPGHPVLLARALFPAIAALRGDAGARELLEHLRAKAVDCGAGALHDVDVPDQLMALQAAQCRPRID